MIAGSRARRFSLFLDTFKPTPTQKVLDLGSTEREYRDSDNYIEKHYPYSQQITALSIDDLSDFNLRYPEVAAVVYGGDKMPFVSKSFDICFCNAVIEHVGEREKQIHFLTEVMRVAKSVFLSTPNRCFPVEIHTKVPLAHMLLPKYLFDGLLRLIGKGWATGGYMNLLSFADLHKIAKRAGITEYRIHQQMLGPFVASLVLITGA